MPIKAVVFDFGGVIMTYTGAFKIWAEMDKLYGLPPNTVAREVTSAEFSEWCGKGRSLFHGTLSVEEAEEEGIYATFLNKKYGSSISGEFRPISIILEEKSTCLINNPKINSAVHQLNGLGFKTALLTNNCHLDKAQSKKRLPYDTSVFDVVVESCIVGEMKPDQSIYKITEERLGLEPSEILFLDDLAENCIAAEERGWKAIRVDPRDETGAYDQLESTLGVKFKPLSSSDGDADKKKNGSIH